MTKSMSRETEEVGEIKSPKNYARKAPRDVEDISVGEVMSGAHQLISLKILGQGSMEGEASGVNVEEP